MIEELIENIRDTWKLSLRAKYFWFRGLFRKERSCEGKIRYNRPSALRAKAAMEKKYGRKFDMYRCIWCGRYHIGGSIDGYMED